MLRFGMSKLVRTRLRGFRTRASIADPTPVRAPIPSPEELGSSDEEWNRKTSLPNGEHIDLSCIWGVEFYTSLHTDTLVTALETLHRGSTREGNLTSDPSLWVRDLRRHRLGGGMMLLGILTPPGSELFFPSHRIENVLPPFCEYALAHIYSLSPSLLAVVVCFVLEDEAATKFNTILEQDKTTVAIPIPNGYSIRNPMFQKSAEIQTLRADLAQAIAHWFRENLPGQFTSVLESSELPTCEFMTTRLAAPFPSASDERLSGWSYVNLLELADGFDIWSSSRTTGLYFRGSTDSRYRSILAIRERELVAAMEEEEAQNQSARINKVDSDATALILARGIMILSEEYAHQLLKIRDQELSDSTSSRVAVEYLERLSKSILRGVDVSAVAAELYELSQQVSWPLGAAADYSTAPGPFARNSVSFIKQFQIFTKEQAIWLVKLEETFRAHATQVGSLIGAREDLRLQKKITLMTITMIVLAVAAILLSVL